jgi:rhodanese-related sulfurtransferase
VSRIFPKAAFVEALMITIIAAVIGLGVNAFHPKGVYISTKRPPILSVDDSVLTEELPRVIFSGGSDTLPRSQEAQDGPITVNTDQVRQLMAGGRAVVIDARKEDEYEIGHIPGAINLPFERISTLAKRINSLSHDKWLICYCDGPPCDLGELLASELWSAGYSIVAIYQEGLDAWKKSNNVEQGGEKTNHAK